MNIHHLELFYYVAKHEGITSAVRKMPYGIGQPALSGQLLQFEKDLGVRLFHRRPFSLTQEGENLYDFAYPFFSKITEVEEQIKGKARQHLRIAASASILRHHMPDILEQMRAKEHNLRITLQEVSPHNVQEVLLRQEVDVAITLEQNLGGEKAKGIHLLSLKPVLIVPENFWAQSWDDLLSVDEWNRGWMINHPLICFPKQEVLRQTFDQELKKRMVVWEPAMEVNSIEAIREYTQRGFGIGLGVHIPGCPYKGVRELTLDNCPLLSVIAMTQKNPKPLVENFLKLTQRHLKQQMG